MQVPKGLVDISVVENLIPELLLTLIFCVLFIQMLKQRLVLVNHWSWCLEGSVRVDKWVALSLGLPCLLIYFWYLQQPLRA